jgi:hypothetical protein
MMKMNVGKWFLFGLILVVAGCSSFDPRNQGSPLLAKVVVVTVQARVLDIDHETREVTLELPGEGADNRLNIVVGDEVKNLSQVRSGDRVTVDYIEAVSIDLFRTGEVEPGVEVTAAVVRAVPGTRPAAAKGIETSVTAVIEAIDKENDLVALRVPEGIYKIVKVSNPANLDRVSVGDKVRITFTSAWALSVNPGPGS